MIEYSNDKRPIGRILKDKADLNKDKILFYFEDEAFTYRQVNTIANKWANGYQALGIKKGDKVTAMLPNSPQFLFHWFGLAKIGGVDNPINTAYKGDLLRHVISLSDSKAVLIHEDFLDRIVPIQEELPKLEKIILYAPSGKRPQVNLKFPIIPYEDMLGGDSEPTPDEEVRHSDPLQLIYTSGTTGPSKGVLLPHNAMSHYSADSVKFFKMTSNDIHYSCLPMFHINIRFFTIIPSLLCNASFAMVQKFSASRLWQDICKYNATIFCLLGAMCDFLWNQPPSDYEKNNPARLFWGGPLGLQRAKDYEERYNLKAYAGYFGMSEANWITSIDVDEADRLKSEDKWAQALSMGRENRDLYQVKLVDEFDDEVPDGELGEIICRPTRPFSMMLEYINMPEKTLEAWRNLWFHTGDVSRKDKDGYFYFVDRKKDYLRRRGENISSFEVEAVINSFPKTAECAVLGIQSEKFNEEDILAVIKLKPGEEFSVKEFLEFCDQGMAKFMAPQFVMLVNEIPRTATGRAEKYKIRKIIKKEVLVEL
jgi:crotonobetaine/carnitine-CoA ligase